MPFTRGRWLLLLPLLLPGASADLFQLQDARPALAADGGAARMIEWPSGGAAYMLASAEAVRINFRGVHAFPRGRALRPLEALGWTAVSCNASAWALCASDVGSVLPVASPPRAPQRAADVLAGWASLACNDNQGKVLVSHAVYDISACDVLDEGLDVVFSERRAYHARTAMALWRYWLCVGLAIVLVRALSYNVQAVARMAPLSQAADARRSQAPPLAASVCLLALTLLDLDSVYVTQADQLFFWCSAAYVGFYLAIHWGERLLRSDHGAEETPVFNILVATLQLLATRLYTAAETPYNLLLLGMLACRAWSKLLRAQKPGDAPAVRSLALTLDALYLSLCVELAFNGSDELVVAVFGVALLGARLFTTAQGVTR